jgi:hypothetical protein
MAFSVYNTTANFERMRITAGGNVGIGITSPGSRLQIQGSGATSSTTALNVTNSTPTSLLFVRDDGNVGIGTNSPITRLNISGSGSVGTAILRIDGSASEAFAYASTALFPNLTANQNVIQSFGKILSNNNTAYVGYRHASDGSTSNILTFGFYGSDNLVNILANGNTGIGTTSPSAKLHVNGTVRIDSTSSQPNTVGHNVELLYTNTATDNIAMGEPDVWLQININGTVYAIPAYVPA